MKQKQFLNVVDDETAHQLLDEAFSDLSPTTEPCQLTDSWGRILADDVCALVDVPGFDRSNMDGFAIRARDSFGAEETKPQILTVATEHAIAAGPTETENSWSLPCGHAVPIATGGVMPRGADAVLMVEDTASAADETQIEVFRAIAPGTNLTGAGSDIGQGEIVLFAGTQLGSRETALLAAIGIVQVDVWRIPRVAVLSTGDEIKAPGTDLEVGEIYDSNSRVICDAIKEIGGEAMFLGICPDDKEALTEVLKPVVAPESGIDMVILSGGTSKGKGDLNFAVIGDLAEASDDSRGIIIHGVSLKPGKPVCVAHVANKPVAVLPGFPTSAIFTFHEFIAPLIRRLSGGRKARSRTALARAPLTIRSMPGRTEFMLVDLVHARNGLAAYPLGAGSGSVSTFSRADGFIRIPRHQERIDAGEELSVQLIGSETEPADLVAIGSHCLGLDLLLSRLARQGFRTKNVLVGSLAGINAQKRGEGDVCGTHLLDEKTGVYNKSFMPTASVVVGGYGRRQGLVFRKDDMRFVGKTLAEIEDVIRTEGPRMVNRNQGSGTRVLLDRLLKGAQPEGFHAEAGSHHAVAAAVSQGRADWGMTLDILAKNHDLEFVFVQTETYELIVDKDHQDRPAVRALAALFANKETQDELRALGLLVNCD